MEFVNIAIVLFYGWIGYLFFSFLSLPTPSLLGGLFSILLLKIVGINLPSTHPNFFIVLQILMGLYFGFNISSDVFKRLSNMLVPVIIMSLWSLGIMFFIGYMLFYVTNLDLLTSLLGAAPGGISEVGIIALAVGADVASVSFLQLLRLLLTLILFPILTKNRGLTRSNCNISEDYEAVVSGSNQGADKPMGISIRLRIRSWMHKALKFLTNIVGDTQKIFSKKVLKTIVIGFCGGLIGYSLGIPAGGMLGALIFTAGFLLAGFKLEAPPTTVRNLTRVGIGTLIGMNFTRDFFYNISDLVLPAVLFTVLIFASSIIMSRVIERITGWDRMTCVLATAPAGLTAMTVLAMEVKCEPFEITMMHLARVLTIKTIVPILIMWFI